MARAPLAAAMLAAGPGAAQDAALDTGGMWEWRATIYGWLPALDSSVGTEPGRLEADITGEDVLDALDFAFMGALEARRGRWSFIGDLLYSDLSGEKDTPFGVLFSKGEVETELTAVTAYAAYRVAASPQAALDLGAGVRWFSLDLDATLTGGALPEQSSSLSEDWADPVLMARGSVAFDDNWFATGLVDAGREIGGHSETWQALATLGYRFNDRWSARIGYRWMNLDRDVDGEPVELDLFGPMIGVSARF